MAVFRNSELKSTRDAIVSSVIYGDSQVMFVLNYADNTEFLAYVSPQEAIQLNSKSTLEVLDKMCSIHHKATIYDDIHKGYRVLFKCDEEILYSISDEESYYIKTGQVVKDTLIIRNSALIYEQNSQSYFVQLVDEFGVYLELLPVTPQLYEKDYVAISGKLAEGEYIALFAREIEDE